MTEFAVRKMYHFPYTGNQITLSDCCCYWDIRPVYVFANEGIFLTQVIIYELFFSLEPVCSRGRQLRHSCLWIASVTRKRSLLRSLIQSVFGTAQRRLCWVLRFSPLLKNHNLQIPIRSRI